MIPVIPTVFAVVLVAAAHPVSAAVEKDRITALPGWDGEVLPSAHYSGYVPLDGGRNVHCTVIVTAFRSQ